MSTCKNQAGKMPIRGACAASCKPVETSHEECHGMAVTRGKLPVPEDHSSKCLCPLLVTPHMYLNETAETPDGLQTLNLDKPPQCCSNAAFLPFPYHLLSHEASQRCFGMGVISSCPIYPSAKVLVPPLGHRLLVGRRSQRIIES